MEEVEELLIRSRGGLGRFLRDHRTQSAASAAVADFLSAAIPKYDSEIVLYKRDTDQWETLLQTELVANQHGFPLSGIADITLAMDRGEKDSVILALVPESVRRINLLNAYRASADDIRKWRETEDLKADSAVTSYLSFYADPLTDAALLKLDGRGSITYALSAARTVFKAIYLEYGFPTITSISHDWIALGHDVWGILVNEVKKTRYIGNIKSGLPHGFGTMKYINGISCKGSWFFGNRDGSGRLFYGTRIREDGPFLDNKPMRDKTYGPSFKPLPDKDNTAVVDVSVFKKSVYVDSATFAVSTHVAPHRQIEKIAKAFGWKDGERYRLTPTFQHHSRFPESGAVQRSPYTAVANGMKVESGPYPPGHDDDWAWPDDEVELEGQRKRISLYGLSEPWLIGTMENPQLLPIKVEAVQLA